MGFWHYRKLVLPNLFTYYVNLLVLTGHTKLPSMGTMQRQKVQSRLEIFRPKDNTVGL